MELSLGLGVHRKVDAFSSIRSLGRPPKIVVLGDSIVNGDGAPGGTTGPGVWLTRSSLYLDGRVVVSGAYGYPGQTAIGHDVAAYRNDFLETNPEIVVVHYGQNSMPAAGALSTPARTAYRNASLNIIRSARATGAVVVTPYLCATNSSATEIAAHNAWLESIAAKEGTVVGPNFTAAYPGSVAAFTFDGVHPNFAGSECLARRFADWLKPRLGSVTTWRDLCLAAGSAGRLIDREGASTVTAAGGYTYGSPPGTFTESQQDSGLAAPSILVNKTGGKGVFLTQASASAEEGKWYLASIRVRGSTLGSNSAFMAYATAYPANVHSVWTSAQIQAGSQWGTIAMLLKLPASCNQIDYKLRIEPVDWSATSSTASLEFAEGKLYDLAAMGFATGVNWNLP